MLGDIPPSGIRTLRTELNKLGDACKFIYQSVVFTVNTENSYFPIETVFKEGQNRNRFSSLFCLTFSFLEWPNCNLETNWGRYIINSSKENTIFFLGWP